MAEESIAHLYDGTPSRRAMDRASIEAEADEGLLLAEYATRMRLKNRIIVDTLTASRAVDLEAWIDEVRLSLGRLRVEAELSARRMAAERDAAAGLQGPATHEHDYRSRDAENLERRRLVSTALARRLIRWENDDARVRVLLAAARDDAYGEMRSAVTSMLSRGRPGPHEDPQLLAERLRLVAAVDLPALATDRERAAPGADAEHRPAPPPTPDAPEPRRGPLRRLLAAVRRSR